MDGDDDGSMMYMTIWILMELWLLWFLIMRIGLDNNVFIKIAKIYIYVEYRDITVYCV